jgi:hypothetical protein
VLSESMTFCVCTVNSASFREVSARLRAWAEVAGAGLWRLVCILLQHGCSMS